MCFFIVRWVGSIAGEAGKACGAQANQGIFESFVSGWFLPQFFGTGFKSRIEIHFPFLNKGKKWYIFFWNGDNVVHLAVTEGFLQKESFFA